MEAHIILPVPDDVNEEFVQSSYAIATEYLKQTVLYIWSKTDGGTLVSILLELGQGRLLIVRLSFTELLRIFQGSLLWEDETRQISPREGVGKSRRVQLGGCKCPIGGGSRWIQVWQMSYLGRHLVMFL